VRLTPTGKPFTAAEAKLMKEVETLRGELASLRAGTKASGDGDARAELLDLERIADAMARGLSTLQAGTPSRLLARALGGSK